MEPFWCFLALPNVLSFFNLAVVTYHHSNDPFLCVLCRFRIDNTDHIIDVNQGRTFMEYDQVNIVCPLYDKSVPEAQTEQFIIYHVNKEEFDMCRIMNAHPRAIVACNKPYQMSYYTISFRSFSPTPGAMEFHAGKDYYFMSTSSKTDLHLRSNGMCRTHNMKLVFKVADGSKPAAPVKQNNQLLTTTEPPTVNNPVSPSIEDNSVVPEKKRKRRKKKKQQKQEIQQQPPNFRQLEPSQVEKVNNLMKQEASIGGILASANSGVFNKCLAISYLIIVTTIFTYL